MRLSKGSALVPAVIAAAWAAPLAGQSGAPDLRLRTSAQELLTVAYPQRYGADPDAVLEDIEWAEEESADLRQWWSRQGPMFLLRAADVAGLPWPYRDIEVYLVRYWPLVSIEYPLVLALDAVQGPGGSAEVPRDEDVRVLLLAHQVVHYLLDDPPAQPGMIPNAAYAHPFMVPGSFELESMVNWVTYSALEEIWGRDRLGRATEDELWLAYNPNHAFVVDELMRERRLTRTYTLARWLRDHPSGSPIFATLADYEERSGAADDPVAGGRGLSGTDYGLDLGAAFDGSIFVAFVDEGSAASRAGVLRGDVLATIEGREVGRDIGDARRRLDESWERDREINLSVVRDGREIYLTLGS